MEDYFECNIKLRTVDDVKEFLSVATSCEFNVLVKQGRYAVDGKSIIGIFSLDLAKPLKVVVETTDEKLREEFLKKISNYVVE